MPLIVDRCSRGPVGAVDLRESAIEMAAFRPQICCSIAQLFAGAEARDGKVHGGGTPAAPSLFCGL
jgi:hypothetical protein